MKVLFLTSWYPDDRSPNSGIFIQSQAQALTSEHEVVVVSSKVDYTKFGLFSYTLIQTKNKSVQEFRLTIRKSLPLYNQLNHLFITCLVTSRIAKNFNPDIIHASVGYPGALWGWIMSRVLGKPFVFTEHTRITNNFRSFFHQCTTLFALKRATCVMAVSNVLAKEINHWTKKEVLVVPNIIEVERFRRMTYSQEPVPQLGFLGGMNTPIKGLDILLHAMAKTGSDFKLHIGGAGSLKREYELLADKLGLRNNCQFYGFIPLEHVPVFMSRLHFFVCSSRYESFCVALIEAMASGLPVVSTRCGGPEDFVKDFNGILCDKEDPEKLCESIQWMIQNFTAYNQDRIKLDVEENFTANRFLKRMNKVYQEAVLARS